MTDPICGMTVEPERAAGSHVYNGQTYYFCSQHCLAEFKKDPEKFLKSPAPERAAHGHGHAHAAATHGDDHPNMHTSSQAAQLEKKDLVYVCPMDPEVRESKPGACPKCGMALERAAPPASLVKTEYVCPMHPEIVRAEPGACPICGMALEPRTVTLDEEANPELIEMTRRFWVSVALSVPVLFFAMSEMIPGQPVQRNISPHVLNWIQLLLATPVVLWGGWP